jgi:hypothetical protein
MRAKLFEIFKNPLFAPRYNLTMEQHRDLTFERLKVIASHKIHTGRRLLEYVVQF